MSNQYRTVTLPDMNEEEHKQWDIYYKKHEVSMRDEPAEFMRRLAVIFINSYRKGINLNISVNG